jgi:hypothetical protein
VSQGFYNIVVDVLYNHDYQDEDLFFYSVRALTLLCESSKRSKSNFE